MNNMNTLINKATIEIESINDLSDMVGNRPHFPAFVLMNNNSRNFYDKLHYKMSKIWPQTISKIIFSAYSISNTFELSSLEDASPIGIDAMKSMLDEVKKTREIFAEMRQWLIYNIIDTSSVKDIKEFVNLYESYRVMKEIVIDDSKTMLIVLLDDSSLKRELSKQVKEFLAKNQNKYDGSFVISNRNYNSSMSEMEDLYSIAANIIVLSNNDAISAYDDMDYATRLSCFYNNHVNTVSYSLFERPNRKIVIQMIDTFLQYMQERTNQQFEKIDVNGYGKKVGITDKVELCEKFLKKINYRFKIEDMEYLPMRNGDNIGNIKLDEMNYAQFRNLTFEGVIEQFVENYYNTTLLPEVNITQFSVEYENEIKNNVFAPEGINITDDLIKDIFIKFADQRVNENLSLNAYIKEQMYLSIRKNILYPTCKEKLSKLRKDSELTLKENKRLHNDFISLIPVDGFDEIGTMYQTITESYLQSEKGREDINNAFRAGNTYEDIIEIIFMAICNIIQANRVEFSLPFIEEWEKRLNRTGDAIYREIYETLDANSRNNIHLYGNFPIDEKLQVYMLHTGDARGLRKTDLFAHLEQAYKGVNDTQFFNTGIDDSLEVLKIIDCSGEKLLW